MDECRVNENKELIVVTNKKTEVYDLTKKPNEKSLMVQSEKDEILHQMDLKTVISNLNNSFDLLDVSYHAVYGFPVQAKIFSLQKMLMDLNDKGILVIGDFRTQSNMVLTELNAVYEWLTSGAETVAIGKLEKFAEYASGMEEQANELAEAYQCMADRTASVLQETMKESSNQYEKTDKLRQLLADFTAEQESAAKMQDSIASRLTALKADYNHLSANEEKAETRENVLSIMGAVFGSLGKATTVSEEGSKLLMAINNEMIRLEEEKTRQLGRLAEYAKKMENIVIDQNATEAAVNALIIAIFCLKRAVAAVKDIALFWSSMKSCCRALSQPGLKDTIKDIQQLPKEGCIEYYYTEDIMYPLMQYMAKWAAAEIISREFITAAEKIRSRLYETLVNSDFYNMSRQEHWDQASRLAGQVSEELQQQAVESGNRIKVLEEKENS
ncbi:MAG: hypothetical protein RRZ63_08180 [Clostridium sp.]